jgi:hypothetical protein
MRNVFGFFLFYWVEPRHWAFMFGSVEKLSTVHVNNGALAEDEGEGEEEEQWLAVS